MPGPVQCPAVLADQVASRLPTPRPIPGSGVVLIRTPTRTPGRIAVVLLGLMLLNACGGDDAPELTDARRIVSLYPVSTEILFRIGAGDRVLARSKWCDYPPEALALPALGDAVGTSAEAVLALRPDLVLAGSHLQEEALAPLASRMRIERATVDDVAGVVDLIERLGRLTGRVDEAGRLTGSIRRAMAAAADRERDPFSFVFVVQREPLIVAGATSYVGELLAALGGKNLAAGVAGRWPTLSLETLVKHAPDVVLDGAMTEADDFWKRLPGLADRVVRVTETVVLRPGPRLPEALEILDRHLRGERR